MAFKLQIYILYIFIFPIINAHMIMMIAAYSHFYSRTYSWQSAIH